MKDLNTILTDIPKDSCMARTVATGFRVIFEGAMPGGQAAPAAERVDNDSVRIGDQIWMSHNLQMPADPDNGIYVFNGETYFTWKAAMRVANSYGNGWRMPSREDWKKLSEFCGVGAAGDHLKSTSGWNDGNGFDTYGFDGKAAGYALPGGSKVSGVGVRGYFWSSTPDGSAGAYYKCLTGGLDFFGGFYGHRSYGFSVRLVKDSA